MSVFVVIKRSPHLLDRRYYTAALFIHLIFLCGDEAHLIMKRFRQSGKKLDDI